jgi:hypothetical protein
MVTNSPPDHEWLDTLLASYPAMLSTRDVANLLAIPERAVYNLLTHENPDRRLPGIKLPRSWRIANAELRQYLLKHHNHTGSTSPGESRGRQ